MVALASLYCGMDRVNEARAILEALNDLLPESPIVLFNLALLSVQDGAVEQALDYLEQLKRLDLGQEIAGRVESLSVLIRLKTKLPEQWGGHPLHELLPPSAKE